MAAHRTRWLPCLVMCPRWILVSDSRWEGVSPAHEHRCRAVGKRETSPISATKIAAMRAERLLHHRHGLGRGRHAQRYVQDALLDANEATARQQALEDPGSA